MFSGRERCYLYDRIIYMILIGGLILPDLTKGGSENVERVGSERQLCLHAGRIFTDVNL